MIRRLKASPCHQRDAHHVEISGRHHVQPEQRRHFARRHGAALDVERALVHAPAERRRIHESGAGGFCRVLNPFQHPLVERETAFGLGAQHRRGRQTRGHQAIASESGIGMRQRPEAANQKAGRGDEEHRQPNLGDDEQAPQPA